MIVVISNCQTPGITAAVRALLPQQEVKSYHIGHPQHYVAAEVAQQASAADACISIPLGAEWGEMATEKLKNTANIIQFPNFVFTGFQPDSVLAWSEVGKYVPSPMIYHSTIAAASYCAGRTTQQTRALFARDTYDKFGYSQAFGPSKQAMLRIWQNAGFDISELFEKWLRSGVFSYVVNHPKAYVINDLASMVLEKSGFTPSSSAELILNQIPDYLAKGPQWPVYPELAKQHGVHGNYTFLTQAGHEPQRALDLDQFIESTFETYTKANAREALITHNKKIKTAFEYLSSAA